MKRTLIAASLICASTVLGGCATPLSSQQDKELETWQAKGYGVEEKSPGLAAGLGVLPGGGSFYTRNYGVGTVNLLFWPLSIFWDPVSGYQGAKSVNYFSTRQNVERMQNEETKQLDYKLAAKQVTTDDYLARKREIDKKYSGYQ